MSAHAAEGASPGRSLTRPGDEAARHGEPDPPPDGVVLAVEAELAAIAADELRAVEAPPIDDARAFETPLDEARVFETPLDQPRAFEPPLDQPRPFETPLDGAHAFQATDPPATTLPPQPPALAPPDDVRPARTGVRLAQVKDELVAWVKTMMSAAVYAVLIVTFGFQVARVEGQSMAPTLEDQDRLIVNKLVYRIGEPRRGDIVMLYYPLNPDKSFVKRVIAEEGDTVRIVDGRVYVNDIPLKDDYVASEYRSHDDWGPQVIPEGYYFVMGDHRNNSSDSRHWGMVPKKYIIGKVQLRWWPVPTARVF